MGKLPSVRCLRCRSGMSYDFFYGLQEQFWGWKCFICGDIVDPVILENRRLMKSGRVIKPRRGRRKSGYGERV